MPLIEDTPTTSPDEKPVAVRVTAPEFRGVTVDTRYTPTASLLSHIEGSSWTVNYYSQVLGLDNALSGQSLDRPATFQQYKLIQNLELKVTTQLSSVQDQTNKEWNTTGQAHIYPCGLIPNEGDCFIADAGDGREAVFEITTSEKRSIYKDAAYTIDYKLISYSNSDGRITDLNNKVVENLYYRHDFLENGQNPLITYGEQEQLKLLQTYYAEIIDFYFTRFFSKEYRTLLVPGQDFPIYDPFLTNAVMRMFRDDAHPNLKLVRVLNVGDDNNFDESNVFTALLMKRRKELVGCMKSTGLVSVRYFSGDPVMNGVRYSGVSYVVYPRNPAPLEDYQHHLLNKTLDVLTLKITPTRLVDLFDVIQIPELNQYTHYQARSVNPVSNGSYVFTPAFYTNATVGQSTLELLVNHYIDGKSYDMRALVSLTQSYTSWAPLEQFYHLPFLLAILRSAIRRM